MFGYDLFGHAMDPSETNFIQITRQMFLAHIMKYALLSSFQQRIKRFGSIVMHITAGKLFRAVVYPRVSRIVFSDLLISPILIGHQVRLLVDKTFNQRTKLGGLIIGNQCRADLALAFDRYQNTLLFGAFATLVRDTFLVAGLTAKVFFIQLDHAAQMLSVFGGWFHHMPDSMTHFPIHFKNRFLS